MQKILVYILDDEKPIAEGLKVYLKGQGFLVDTFNAPEDYLYALSLKPADISLLDIRLPRINGLEVLKRSKKIHPYGEYIMISGHGDVDDVIEAMRLEAFDYIRKPFELRFVEQTIKKTNRYIEFKKRYDNLQDKYLSIIERLNSMTEQKIQGSGTHIRSILNKMNLVAQAHDTSVLITGESGTGKELVAQGIHNLSSRKDHSFYPINMTAITSSLFESQMFGHVKGAFTDARQDKKGVLRTANRGTVFLDEIGDMSQEAQAKLLRFLEEKKVSPVGSEKSFEVDTRIIAATNKNLEEKVKEGSFREDLYYRLNVFRIELEPLRNRREDIPELFDYFVKKLSASMKKPIHKITDEVYPVLTGYDYPGNIRELRNITEHAIILSEDKTISSHQFPEFFNKHATGNGNADSSFDLSVNEKKMILKALRHTGHNKSKAAKLLGISWQALDRKMKKHEL